MRKGLKVSIDPKGCKMKGWVYGCKHTEFGKRVEGVYIPKRLQDEGMGAWV